MKRIYLFFILLGLAFPALAQIYGPTNRRLVRVTWSNAQVVALGAALSGDITIVTLPKKTVVENAYIIETTQATGGAHAKGTITLTGLPSLGVKAQGTITMSGVAVAGETFVVGATTFTWRAARAVAGEVTIGASAAEAVTNIVTAITADSTDVTAADGAGDTVVVTAAAYGVGGNALTFTEAATNMAVDGAGTLGTTTLGVAPDSFVVDTRTFTWKTARSVAGDVVRGASAAACVTNIVAAITADLATVTAADGAGDTVVVTVVAAGAAGNALTFTESTANLTMDGAGTLGGTLAGDDLATLTAAVGRTGPTYLDYIKASSIMAAANTIYGAVSGDRGTNLTGYDLPSATATTVVKMHLISTGTNLANVTTSSGVVYLVITTLP